MNKTVTVLLLSLGLSVSLGTHADPKAGLYRWHDENGTLQYSDRPPEGVESELVTTYGGTVSKETAPATNTGAPQKDASGNEKEAAAENAPVGEMEVLPEKDPNLCKQARDNMKALEGARIRITEPDGTKRLLNNDERDTQKANAQKVIDMHC